ncbi:MAG TPA: WD40 repeat domain-containing protein, partial [Ilumatobacteraceae bacterium]|nr:WD40 repeat domain-containing protein [Ilumatobacteraceae bacterium]
PPYRVAPARAVAPVEPVWTPPQSWSPLQHPPDGPLPPVPGAAGFDTAAAVGAGPKRRRLRWSAVAVLVLAALIGSAVTVVITRWVGDDDSATAGQPGGVIELRGHRDTVYLAGFSPDGATAFTSGADGRLIVWDARTGAEINRYEDLGAYIAAASFDRSGSTIVAAVDSQLVAIDAIAPGTRPAKVRLDLDLVHVVSTPDDDVIVVGFDPDDYEVGEILRFASVGGERLRRIGSGYPEALAPDGELALVSEYDRTGSTVTHVVDTLTGAETELEQLLEFVFYADFAVFSDDGSKVARILFEYEDEPIALTGIWDTTTGALITELAVPADDHLMLAFDHSGQRLLVVSYGSDFFTTRLELFDANTGERQRTVTSQAVGGFSFSPDDAQIAVATADGTVTLYDTASGHKQRVLEGHAGPIAAIAYSPDGSRLITASNDGTARIWHLTDN